MRTILFPVFQFGPAVSGIHVPQQRTTERTGGTCRWRSGNVNQTEWRHHNGTSHMHQWRHQKPVVSGRRDFAIWRHKHQFYFDLNHEEISSHWKNEWQRLSVAWSWKLAEQFFTNKIISKQMTKFLRIRGIEMMGIQGRDCPIVS